MRSLACVALSVLVLALAPLRAQSPGTGGGPPAVRSGPFAPLAGALIENRGQLDPAWRLATRIRDSWVLFGERSIRVVFSSKAAAVGAPGFDLAFPGVSAQCRLVLGSRRPGALHYFLGNDPDRWRTGAALYESVVYESVHEGIDVRFHVIDGQLHYDVHLRAGADVTRFALRIPQCDGIELRDDGALSVPLVSGVLVQSAPRAFLAEGETDSPSSVLSCSYRLIDSTTLGFRLDRAAAGRAVVIDPGLDWSTFLGGSDSEWASSVSRDGAGNLYVAGMTLSADFPVTRGAFQTQLGGIDPFVARFSPDGSTLQYCTFVGGSSFEDYVKVSVNAAGVATLGGFTQSPDFPTTAGAFQRVFRGPPWGDSFIARLGPNGDRLLAASYFGGNQQEIIFGLGTDAQDDVVFAGATGSVDLPTSASSFQRALAGDQDAFVGKMDAGLQQLRFCTYVGGLQGDNARDIMLDAGGSIYVVGVTGSASFPVTSGAFDRINHGLGDAFVSRFDSNGNLLASTFLGGASVEIPLCLVLLGQGRVGVAGTTASTDFPTTANALARTYRGGYRDAFIAVLDPSLGSLSYSTFLGGSNIDQVNAIASDGPYEVVVCGQGGSLDFPVTRGAFQMQPTNQVWFDSFITRLRIGESQPRYSTFLGGNRNDMALALSLDGRGGVTVVGQTESTDFPTTVGAYRRQFGGAQESFVTHLDLQPTGAARYGPGTPACAGNVIASVTRMPEAGVPDFGLACVNAPPIAAGFWLLGAGQDLAGFPFQGALIHVRPDRFVLPLLAVSDALGGNVLPVAIPPQTSGIPFFAQSVWVNTATCGAPSVLSSSNGISIRIQ